MSSPGAQEGLQAASAAQTGEPVPGPAQPGLNEDAAAQAGGRRKHHLLRHELTAEAQAAAVAHFGAESVDEAAHKVWALKQRELQEAFAKVYGQKTSSCNNEWMRGKLLQALGLDSRWRPPSLQAEHPSAAPTTETGDGGELGRSGRKRRAAALAAQLLTREIEKAEDGEEEEEGSAEPTPRRPSRPLNRSSSGGAARRGRQEGAAASAAAAAAPAALAQDAAAGLLAASLGGAALSQAAAAGPAGAQPSRGWRSQAEQQPTWQQQAQRQQAQQQAQQQQLQQQQQQLQQAAAALGQGLGQARSGSLLPPAAGSLQLDGPGLAAADAALALATGQRVPLTLTQQQQLLLLEQQHQQQQAALQQQFLIQQQLLLQQQQLEAAQRATAPLPGAPAAQVEEPSWGQLAGAGSAGLPPLSASASPSLLASALSAALPAAGAAPQLGSLSWQLLSAAARQQLEGGRQAAAELARAGFGSAEGAEAAAEALLANDARRMQGLAPALAMPGLLSRQVSLSSATAAATATAAAAAVAAASDQPVRASPAISLNPFAVAAVAAAAAEQQQQQQQQQGSGLHDVLPSLATMLSGSGSLPLLALGPNSNLSAKLQSLYNSLQDGGANF
ncbi:hypothetical protein ABPG75_001331 [Micractinium tetrahymenae]